MIFGKYGMIFLAGFYLMLTTQCSPATPNCKEVTCLESIDKEGGQYQTDDPQENTTPNEDAPHSEASAELVMDGGHSPDTVSPMDVSPDQQIPTPESQNSESSGGECKSTSECKAKYGSRATDCVDSQSNKSYCQCGSVRCSVGQPPDRRVTPEQSPPQEAVSSPDKGLPKTKFREKNGYIIMEMESVVIPNGHKWQKRTKLKGYKGTGYYRFTGNSICNGPANSPLRYTFTVVKAATFQLRLRCARIYHCVKGKPHNSKNHCGEKDRTCTSLGEPTGDKCPGAGQCIRTDISNDAFVLIEDASGKYLPFVKQPGSTIGKPIKLFGGGNNAWGWSGKRALDISGKHDALWKLSPGVYTLVVQGRSQAFRIDRIVLFDDATGSTKVAETLPETR